MSDLRPVPAPVSRACHLAWRRVVLDAVRRHPRGSMPLGVHVGRPTGPCASLTIDDRDGPDLALATDLLGVLLLRVRRPAGAMVWLTRSGDLASTSRDHGWLAAAAAAFGEADLPLTMVVVTRHGWCDVLSGVGHDWGRVPH